MAETRTRDRIFAGLGAILFLVTSLAFTGFAIFESSRNNTDPLASQTETVACTMDAPAAEALAAPEVFTPQGAVTDLQITDIVPGSGAAAKAGDCLQMKYYGTLASNGTLFDENFTKPTSLQMQLGAKQVITGWEEGLVGLKEGGTRRLVIPAGKAYGSQAQGTIPANSDLVFVVKLVKIKK
ncbi:MAG TPA: FKBP-type peptidyl-prolyl cis-trans isomerase [Candidatus Saccharibacteria bacterium]|jgi:FKBP-type peptidyl-prolyl cis-trans isomerase|nr:FKBP-type peptidyl-prolyl cis-trans isomerase [Candidatus Saccharibacteria bacterium]